MNFDTAFHTYETFIDRITAICTQYPWIGYENLGKSFLGRDIPLLRLGNGSQKILYVGAHHGCEWITAELLLQFLWEYAECFERRQRTCNIDVSYLHHTRTIFIIPMLNPDGAALSLCGAEAGNPLAPRLIQMNGGSEDFSAWKANGRGVDLNRNYNAGFSHCMKFAAENGLLSGAPRYFCGQYPESEPETAALCRWIRSKVPLQLLLSLHTAGEEIYWDYGGKADYRTKTVASILARLSGYKLAQPDPGAAHGGLKDWYLMNYSGPALTVECGAGESPLPRSSLPSMYSHIRPMLFQGALL